MKGMHYLCLPAYLVCSAGGKLPHCRSEERSAVVNQRKRLGDWVVDTMTRKDQKTGPGEAHALKLSAHLPVESL
jgi:hypothetical protein